MSPEEVDELQIKGYTTVAKSCRTDAAAGGVLILVSTEVDAEEVETSQNTHRSSTSAP